MLSDPAVATLPPGNLDGRALLADAAVAVLAAVAPKIDSTLPRAAADQLFEALFYSLEASGGEGAASSRRRGACPAAHALGQLGRSKRLRPALVARLVACLASSSPSSSSPSLSDPASVSGPVSAAEGNSTSPPLVDSSPAQAQSHAQGRQRILVSAVVALYAVAGCPGGKPDLAPSVAPLISLLSPASVASCPRASGLAAGALFRLSTHLPFRAIMKASELPSFLVEITSPGSALLHDDWAAAAIGSLVQNVGLGTGGPARTVGANTPKRGVAGVAPRGGAELLSLTSSGSAAPAAAAAVTRAGGSDPSAVRMVGETPCLASASASAAVMGAKLLPLSPLLPAVPLAAGCTPLPASPELPAPRATQLLVPSTPLYAVASVARGARFDLAASPSEVGASSAVCDRESDVSCSTITDGGAVVPAPAPAPTRACASPLPPPSEALAAAEREQASAAAAVQALLESFDAKLRVCTKGRIALETGAGFSVNG